MQSATQHIGSSCSVASQKENKGDDLKKAKPKRDKMGEDVEGKEGWEVGRRK